MDGYLTSEQLAERLGVKRASIYRMHTRGDLPSPEKIGRTPVWLLPVIEAWERERPGHGWRKGAGGVTTSTPGPGRTADAQTAPNP